jgi:chemotaxis protein MotB
MGKKFKKSGGGDGGGGHGGGGSMRWLLTYADMITLLVGFFVMLYALSILDLKRFQAVAGALRMDFGGEDKTMPEGGKGVLIAGPGEGAKISLVAGTKEADAFFNQIKEVAKLRQRIRQSGVSKDVQIVTDERGLVVRIAAEGILFKQGQSQVGFQALQVLWDVAEMLVSLKNHVRVEGHTCNSSPSGTRFPSNWELSAARAASVVKVLVDSGVSPHRLSAVGYADTRPIAPMDVDENKAKNRRVDIVVLLRAEEEDEPPPDTDEAAEEAAAEGGEE